jgi:large subunit ribosomal protein L4
MQAVSFSAAMRGVPVLQSNRRAPNARVQTATITKASVVAEPASLEVKSTDGSSSGKASLSLRVADAETANGLVHRYVVMVRQNMRQVRMM